MLTTGGMPLFRAQVIVPVPALIRPTFTKPNQYRRDRSWSDQFIPEIRRIVGPYLLIPSTLEQDTKEAADLVVLKANSVTIACRVRRPGYLSYKNEFTMRLARASGQETELSKIINGWGDWMFYAHSNVTEDGFAHWMLLDLSSWRSHMIKHPELIRAEEHDSQDGTSFIAYDARSFTGEPNLMIATSNDQTMAAASMCL